MFADYYSDPELSCLAGSLPLRCLGAKAHSTTEPCGEIMDTHAQQSRN